MSKAYRFVNLETPDSHTVVESINTKFFENIFLIKKN